MQNDKDNLNKPQEEEDNKKKPKYFAAPEVMEVANKLIEQYHSVLIDARIQYCFKDGTWNKNGNICPGDVKKLSPYVSLIAKYDFGMIINAKYWNCLEKDKREALIDHLLSYCSCDIDNEGNKKWIKVTPPVVEFPSVTKRHGAYDVNLELMQQSLDEYREENNKNRNDGE